MIAERPMMQYCMRAMSRVCWLRGGYLCVCLILSGASRVSAQPGMIPDASEFTLDLKPAKNQFRVDEPIQLVLTLTYSGPTPIRIRAFDGPFGAVRFDIPPGWKRREQPTAFSFDGMIPSILVRPNVPLDHAFFLNTLFSSMSTGKAEVVMRLHIWPMGDTAGSRGEGAGGIVLERACAVTLLPGDSRLLAEDISRIVSGLRVPRFGGW